MNNTIEQKKQNNYKLLFNTIKSLSNSQDYYYSIYYRRLLNGLIHMDEDERVELINNLPIFNNASDVIMWLEP